METVARRNEQATGGASTSAEKTAPKHYFRHAVRWAAKPVALTSGYGLLVVSCGTLGPGGVAVAVAAIGVRERQRGTKVARKAAARGAVIGGAILARRRAAAIHRAEREAVAKTQAAEMAPKSPSQDIVGDDAAPAEPEAHEMVAAAIVPVAMVTSATVAAPAAELTDDELESIWASAPTPGSPGPQTSAAPPQAVASAPVLTETIELTSNLPENVMLSVYITDDGVTGYMEVTSEEAAICLPDLRLAASEEVETRGGHTLIEHCLAGSADSEDAIHVVTLDGLNPPSVRVTTAAEIAEHFRLDLRTPTHEVEIEI